MMQGMVECRLAESQRERVGSCGVVWCGVVWCGVVWCGVVWCGVVWCGVVWCHVMSTNSAQRLPVTVQVSGAY